MHIIREILQQKNARTVAIASWATMVNKRILEEG